MHRQNVTSRDK